MPLPPALLAAAAPELAVARDPSQAAEPAATRATAPSSASTSRPDCLRFISPPVSGVVAPVDLTTSTPSKLCLPRSDGREHSPRAAPMYARAMPAPASRGPRLRGLGLRIGRFESGPANAITDVSGVTVGHVTVWRDEPQPPEGRGVARTGVTAVLPSSVETMFAEPVP